MVWLHNIEHLQVISLSGSGHKWLHRLSQTLLSTRQQTDVVTNERKLSRGCVCTRNGIVSPLSYCLNQMMETGDREILWCWNDTDKAASQLAGVLSVCPHLWSHWLQKMCVCNSQVTPFNSRRFQEIITSSAWIRTTQKYFEFSFGWLT